MQLGDEDARTVRPKEGTSIDGIARGELCDLGSDSLNDARYIKAGTDGVSHIFLGGFVQSPSNTTIGVIDRKGANAENDTVGG